MVLGGANTGVSLAMSAVAKEKKVPFFAIGAAGASLTGKDCTPYTVHYAYDTTALGNGTATTILKRGRQDLVLPDRRLRVRHAVAGCGRARRRRPTAARSSARCACRSARRISPLTSCRRRASGAQVLGLANAGTDFSNSLKAANELGITKTMKPAALLAFITDIHALGLETAQGPLSHDRLVLGPQRQEPRLRQAVSSTRSGASRRMIQAAYYSATTDLSQRGQGRRHDRRRTR